MNKMNILFGYRAYKCPGRIDLREIVSDGYKDYDEENCG
jgi:hypothetical protein